MDEALFDYFLINRKTTDWGQWFFCF